MTTEEMASLINCLTSDNDERQELWVHYLENGDARSLCYHLEKIRKQFSEDQLLQVTIWKRASTHSENALLSLFENFTDLEQSIMSLLALGASLPMIGGIKGIGVVRLHHIIAVVREHPCWNEDGLKDEAY
jgi:hypothetical protein